MPNKYRRTLGKRKYHDFSKEELENIKSGFRATGLVPLDREVVFKRLPKQVLTPRTTEIAEVLKDIFEATRYPTKDRPQSKRKKLTVPAGQSITVDSISTPEAHPSGSNQQRKKPKKISKLKTNQSKYDFSSSDEVDDLKLDLTEETYETDEETEETEETEKTKAREVTDYTLIDKEDLLQENAFVIVELRSQKGNKKRYVATITSKDPLQCSFLKEQTMTNT
ncbi:hypothetical protein QE152_g25448 [Popillia japonica]|uniref:Uncharacterized protein n=1 Tax=Popillia japonica TaxID=7064 RepID=A0AAW1K1P0_POPJA